VESGLTSVDKWTQNLHEDFNMGIQGTQFDVQVIKVLVEATQLEFRMQLAEVGVEVAGTR
jgi:hypothetical protein